MRKFLENFILFMICLTISIWLVVYENKELIEERNNTLERTNTILKKYGFEVEEMSKKIIIMIIDIMVM